MNILQICKFKKFKYVLELSLINAVVFATVGRTNLLRHKKCNLCTTTVKIAFRINF